MKLTPEEQRTYDALVEKMYRSPPVERTAVKYPAVFYIKETIRAEKDNEGKHSPFSVYDGDELVCKCVYKKGALALCNYIERVKNG